VNVEPLGPSHDRAAFHSGVAELDRYLHHQASQDAKRKVAAPFVLIDSNGAILGYYSLSAYSLRLIDRPEPWAKKLPRYPLLPATLVGRLAVGKEHRGRHLGRLLLIDALERSWKNTAEVGSIGVVVEAYDEAAQAFYRHHEFLSLLDRPGKMFMAMSTIEKAFRTL